MHASRPSAFFEAPLFSDLDAALARELDARSQVDRLTPLLLVTPTTRLGAHLRRRALRREAPPLHLQMLTFPELVARMTATRREREERHLLPEAGPAFLARRALARDKRPEGFFVGALELRGFRYAMANCFEELAAAGLVAPRDLERFILQHGVELGRRTRHTLELALGYRRMLEEKHEDSWSMFRQAAAMEPEEATRCLGTRQLWLYGFEQLEILQRQLVESLIRSFELRLFCLASSAGRSGPAAWLESLGLERLAPLPLPASPLPEVHVLSSPGDEAEAREMARQILQAASRGIPFHEMAVATRNVASLPLIEETLVGLGVPCTAPTLHALATRRAGRALLQWLELAESGLSPGPVLELLLLLPARWSAWCGIAADPVTSAWERVAREVRLGTGLEDWRQKLRRENEAWRQRLSHQGEARSAAETAAAGAREELLQVAEVLTQELRALPERARWSEFARVSADFVARVMQDDRESRMLRQALGRMAALDSLAAPRPSRLDFREALRSHLGRIRVASADSVAGGVTLGTAEELQGLTFRWIGIAGLQEGEWPGPVAEDPVLPDRERQQLNRLLGEPQALPIRAHQVEKQRGLFRGLVAAAGERLVLSFARLEPTTASTRLPSTLLLEYAEQRQGRRLDYEELAALRWYERVPLRRREAPTTGPILSEEEFDALAVAQLPRAAARRYVRKLGAAAARGLAVESLRNGRPRFTVFDGLLSDREAQQSLSRALAMRAFSASQLTTYATCPFRFFMRHLLRVEPLDRSDRREPTVLEVGLLVHGILERFYGDLAMEGVQLADLDLSLSRQRLLQAADVEFAALEAKGQQGARLLWEIRKQSLREDLGRFLRQEVQRLRTGDAWMPAQFEVRFGPEEGGSPAVSVPGGTVRFRGVIDRIDHHREHDGVCVVDYKSGRAMSSKHNPQALQLVLYLMAACRSDPQRLRRSEARFLYVTRRGGFVMQRLAGARLAMRLDDFTTLVRSIRAGIEAGELFPQPGAQAVHCTVCDYRGLCDARIARQVQRKGGGEQDARWRGLPDFGADLEPVDPLPKGDDDG